MLKHVHRVLETILAVNRNGLFASRTNSILSIIPKRGCSTIDKNEDEEISLQKSFSYAMKSILAKVDKYETMINEKEKEFVIGKRHLANMMGIPIDKFNQMDIDKSIEYLFPSGLTQKLALPKMRHPRSLYPKVDTTIKFDNSGRPFHYLFYTGKPKYYTLLQNIGEEQKRLDKIYASGEYDPETDMKIDLFGSEFVPNEKVSTMLNEDINRSDYTFLIQAITNLCYHPLSSLATNFIQNFRSGINISSDRQMAVVNKINNRIIVCDTGKKKRAVAEVTVWMDGTGKFNVNNMDILFFEEELHRSAVVYPLIFTNMAMKVDVVAHVKHICDGKYYDHVFEPSGKHVAATTFAIAIRLALSRALLPLVDDDMKQRMRIAGLLTMDIRRRERKKPGQPGSRKKQTWKAR